jgi:hypothetical protein
MKENISGTARGLRELKQIRVRDYDFTNDAQKHRHQGLIAQELSLLYPEAVTVGGDNPITLPWRIDYGRITPLAVKSVQELKAKLDAYKKEAAALREEIRQLKETP